MYCSKCGAENEENAKFCAKCGEMLHRGQLLVASEGESQIMSARESSTSKATAFTQNKYKIVTVVTTAIIVAVLLWIALTKGSTESHGDYSALIIGQWACDMQFDNDGDIFHDESILFSSEGLNEFRQSGIGGVLITRGKYTINNNEVVINKIEFESPDLNGGRSIEPERGTDVYTIKELNKKVAIFVEKPKDGEHQRSYRCKKIQ